MWIQQKIPSSVHNTSHNSVSERLPIKYRTAVNEENGRQIRDIDSKVLYIFLELVVLFDLHQYHHTD